MAYTSAALQVGGGARGSSGSCSYVSQPVNGHCLSKHIHTQQPPEGSTGRGSWQMRGSQARLPGCQHAISLVLAPQFAPLSRR